MTQPQHGTAAPPPPRTVPKFGKKSFTGANAVDKMKAYLRDVPVLHKRLVTVVEGLERNLAEARVAKENFDGVTASIQAAVDRWEEEQKHDEKSQPGPEETACPPGPAGAEGQPGPSVPASRDALPRGVPPGAAPIAPPAAPSGPPADLPAGDASPPAGGPQPASEPGG